MWFKNLQLYRVPAQWNISAAEIESFLTKQLFQPCTSLDMQSQGWISPRDNGMLVHTVNQQMMLQLRTEKKLLPTSVINQVAKEKASEIEEQQSFKPGRKQMRELKEQVADELLPRAFSISTNTNVWIDPVNGWLVVDAASASKAEDVLKLLIKAIDKFPLQMLRVKRSPLACMTDWLSADEAPGGFTIDQDSELRATGEGKATVRYIRQTLEAADVQRHIAAGKQCTRLAMTWADRISFVLTDSLTIKKISALDVLKEGSDPTAKNDDERFDSDAVLMTGELNRMLADLVEALGGEHTEQADWVQKEAQGSSSIAVEGDYDALYDQAKEIVLTQRRCSISLVQRHLRIGYNRAARLIAQMEVEGIVSAMQSNGNREIVKAAA